MAIFSKCFDRILCAAKMINLTYVKCIPEALPVQQGATSFNKTKSSSHIARLFGGVARAVSLKVGGLSDFFWQDKERRAVCSIRVSLLEKGSGLAAHTLRLLLTRRFYIATTSPPRTRSPTIILDNTQVSLAFLHCYYFLCASLKNANLLWHTKVGGGSLTYPQPLS